VSSCVTSTGNGQSSSCNETAGIGSPPTPGIGGRRTPLIAPAAPPAQRGATEAREQRATAAAASCQRAAADGLAQEPRRMGSRRRGRRLTAA